MVEDREDLGFAELSPRTICTFSRELSSRRRTLSIVLEELSGVRERRMIISMATTARPQQLCLPESQSVDLSARLERELNADAGKSVQRALCSGRGREQSGRATGATSISGRRPVANVPENRGWIGAARVGATRADRAMGVSGRAAFVAMMEAADLRDGHDGRRRRKQSRPGEELARLCPATNACETVRNTHDRASSAAAGPLR